MHLTDFDEAYFVYFAQANNIRDRVNGNRSCEHWRNVRGALPLSLKKVINSDQFRVVSGLYTVSQESARLRDPNSIVMSEPQDHGHERIGIMPKYLS